MPEKNEHSNSEQIGREFEMDWESSDVGVGLRLSTVGMDFILLGL